MLLLLLLLLVGVVVAFVVVVVVVVVVVDFLSPESEGKSSESFVFASFVVCKFLDSVKVVCNQFL